jgi:hypothetical protein
MTIDGRAWLMTNEGAYRVDGNGIRRLPDLDDKTIKIRDIQGGNGQVLVGTSKGLYRIAGEAYTRAPDDDLDIRSVTFIEGKVWLATSKGAYRIDDDVEITVNPRSAGTWWANALGSILPSHLWIAGSIDPDIRYISKSDNEEPYETSDPKQFGIIMETDKALFDKAVSNREYISLERFKPSISSGSRTLHFSIRDKWGNTFEHHITGFALPILTLIGSITPLVWLSGLFLIVALAPRFKTFNGLLMNPFLRKVGMFGLLPPILTLFPIARRHILNRYLKAIREDKHFEKWRKRFVVPSDEFSPDSFGKLLAEHRALFLTGQSGIGKTSYLTFLTAHYAANRYGTLPKGLIPVLIPLAIYQGESPENMFHAQLASLGQFTDKDITSYFLQQGGFLILLDGLNEVDKVTRDSVNRFIDVYGRANYFCVSSQQPHLEFNRLKGFEMTSLNKEKIDEIITNWLDDDPACKVMEQFNENTYRIYKIPQDLALAIAIVEKGGALPQSREELYEETLALILNTWTESEVDYQHLLFERAYTMLQSQDPFFDSQNNPLPESVCDILAEKKFLARRSGRFHFRHNLIRDYLAAKYFSSRWQDLLSDEKFAADSNWYSMLQFAIPNLPPEDVKTILIVILSKNKVLAGTLFMWAQNHHPELCTDWAREFEGLYGQASLETLEHTMTQLP